MSAIPDRNYNAACGRLAGWLGISIAAARRRVDIRASQEGLSDTAARIALAERMLAEAQASGVDTQALLAAQLGALSSEEDFMTED
ncbi:MAG: hypothetical protein ACK59A_15725 [Cyanobacteriota bacterium]|jgi:hypothetical protein